MKDEDIDTIYPLIFNDKDVVEYTFGHELLSKEKTKELLKQVDLKILVLKQTNEIIGLGGALECKYLDRDDFEIGFILGAKYWGNGYAYEIGQAQISYIKDILKAKRVLALTHPKNIGSIKTIEKLGLKYNKTIEVSRGDREVYILNF